MIPQTPPAGRSILARADLLRAMATGRDEMVSLVASQLGLEFRQNVIQKQVVTPFVLQDQVAPQSDNRLESSIYPNDIVNIDLWLTINYKVTESTSTNWSVQSRGVSLFIGYLALNAGVGTASCS